MCIKTLWINIVTEGNRLPNFPQVLFVNTEAVVHYVYIIRCFLPFPTSFTIFCMQWQNKLPVFTLTLLFMISRKPFLNFLCSISNTLSPTVFQPLRIKPTLKEAAIRQQMHVTQRHSYRSRKWEPWTYVTCAICRAACHDGSEKLTRDGVRTWQYKAELGSIAITCRSRSRKCELCDRMLPILKSLGQFLLIVDMYRCNKPLLKSRRRRNETACQPAIHPATEERPQHPTRHHWLQKVNHDATCSYWDRGSDATQQRSIYQRHVI